MEKQNELVIILPDALDEMLRDISRHVHKVRRRCSAYSRQGNMPLCNYDTGDYGLCGTVHRPVGSKMGSKWTGPFYIGMVLSFYLFEV